MHWHTENSALKTLREEMDGQVVVTHTFNPRTLKAEADRFL